MANNQLMVANEGNQLMLVKVMNDNQLLRLMMVNMNTGH